MSYAPASEEQRRITEVVRNEARRQRYGEKRARRSLPLRVGETELTLTPHHIENIGARIIIKLALCGRILYSNLSADDTRLFASYLSLSACEAEDIRLSALGAFLRWGADSTNQKKPPGGYKSGPAMQFRVGQLDMTLIPYHAQGLGARVNARFRSNGGRILHIHNSADEVRLFANYLKLAACEAEALGRPARRLRLIPVFHHNNQET